uniref:Uncharacterized protein n=1 Tax=Trypanosoma congolense (strain IL3000) TaxID=1068625 RepID=G0URP7_TRYCI|nr:hypothetical protein, unlikely [Trypanosoma congolense IL3000]
MCWCWGKGAGGSVRDGLRDPSRRWLITSSGGGISASGAFIFQLWRAPDRIADNQEMGVGIRPFGEEVGRVEAKLGRGESSEPSCSMFVGDEVENIQVRSRGASFVLPIFFKNNASS